MIFTNLFKKKTEYWDSYKTYLINEFHLSFTILVDIDKQSDLLLDKIVSSYKNNNTKICNFDAHIIDKDARFIYMVGILSKAIDSHIDSIILTDTDDSSIEINNNIEEAFHLNNKSLQYAINYHKELPMEMFSRCKLIILDKIEYKSIKILSDLIYSKNIAVINFQ